MNEKEPVKINLTTAILFVLLFLAVVVIIGMFIYFNNNNAKITEEAKLNTNVSSNVINSENNKTEAVDDKKDKADDNNKVVDNKTMNMNSDQLYKEYISNFNKNLDKMHEDDFDKETLYLSSNRSGDLIFDISINKNHEALIRFTQGSKLEKKYPNGYKVENVVKAFMVPDGNGDYYCVDFIKEDGSLYSLDYDKLVNNNEVVINKNTKYKNVVDVIRVGASAIHVDINGNWMK